MENLVYSLNATMPIFLMMVLGYFLHRIGSMDDSFASKLNTYVFKIALPLNLFHQLAGVDILKSWDTGFVLFCFFATLLSIAIAALFARILVKDHAEQGEFIQAAYRSSASLVGMAFIENIYGISTMGPLMIIGAVPLYNVVAVVALSLTAPGSRGLDAATMKKTLLDILKNPIILGILFGILWSLLPLSMPKFLSKTISSVGGTATPLGLMAMGAAFDFKKATGNLKEALTCSFFKLIGWNLLFLPLAIWLGYRGEQLIAILCMRGSATTVTCYVMAKNMHHEGTLTSSAVMLTTLFSSFTLTMFLYIVKSMALV